MREVTYIGKIIGLENLSSDFIQTAVAVKLDISRTHAKSDITVRPVCSVIIIGSAAECIINHAKLNNAILLVGTHKCLYDTNAHRHNVLLAKHVYSSKYRI